MIYQVMIQHTIHMLVTAILSSQSLAIMPDNQCNFTHHSGTVTLNELRSCKTTLLHSHLCEFPLKAVAVAHSD